MKTFQQSCWVYRRAFGFALLVSWLARVVPAFATEYYVDSYYGDNAYDGLSNVVANGHGPKLNAADAIWSASNGDHIAVASGFYQELHWNLNAKDLTLYPQDDVIVSYNSDPWLTDADEDGIPDAWEALHGLNYLDALGDNGAAGDPDGDSYVNIQEYYFGSDPRNPASPANPPVPLPWYNQWTPHSSNYIALRSISLYRDNEQVAITSAVPMQVWHYTNGLWGIRYDGPGTNIFPRLEQGYYLIQSGNERASFMVLSTNWDSAAYAPVGDPNWIHLYPSNSDYVTLVTAFHPRWSRLWGGRTNDLGMCVEWSCIQTNADPDPSHWRWETLDGWVNSFTNSGDQTKLFHAAWNAEDQPFWQDTNNIDVFCGQYGEFVRQIIRRYTNMIGRDRFAIEVWNEPNSWCPGGNDWTNFYCAMVASCAVVRAQENSSVRFIGPADGGSTIGGRETDVLQALHDSGAYINLYAISFHDAAGSWIQTEFLPANGCTGDRAPHPWTYYLDRLKNWFGTKPLYRDEMEISSWSVFSKTNCAAPGGSWQRQFDPPDPCYEKVDAWTAAMRWLRHEIVTLSYGTTNDEGNLHAALTTQFETCFTEYDGFIWGGWGPEFKGSTVIAYQPWIDGAHDWWHTNDVDNGSVYSWTRADGSTVVVVWTQEGRRKVPAVALPQRYDAWGNAVGWADIREEPTFYLSPTNPAAAGSDAFARITGSP